MRRVGWTKNAIAAKVEELGPWFHDVDLDGVRTAPDHFLGDFPGSMWRAIGRALPADLKGKTALDIGCNSGFYAIELKRRGADRVVAIDHDPHYLAQARFHADVRGVDIEFAELSVYDVETLGERFDIVLFLGVLYHLRHPLLALDRIRTHVARDLMLFQSMQRGADGPTAAHADLPFEERAAFDAPGWPKLHFIELAYAGDPTNWWAPNAACVEAMLRSAGFDILQSPGIETYLCRVAAGRAPVACI